jgi:transposase
MKTTKKQYSAAEKTKIALEAIKGELTIAQISSKYGVHSTQISNWKQQAIDAMQNGFNSPDAVVEKPKMINQNLWTSYINR